MGKSAGKTILGIAGFAFGFAYPAAFGFASSAVWSGALYGLSLGTMIWSSTHKPSNDQENYSRFDTFMNSIDSTARIPVIYGTRKFGGLQSYHLDSSDGKTLTKDVIISEGEVQGIYGVTANELSLGGSIFALKNVKYSDATVTIVNSGPTDNDKTMRLYANGKTTSIALQHPVDLHDNQDNDFSCYIYKLINYIEGIGYQTTLKNEGWIVVNPSITTDPPENIGVIGTINCYNSPVSVGISKLASPNSNYVFSNGSTSQSPPSNYLAVGGYRKMAWLRATLIQTDSLQGGNPNVTYICQGKKIIDTRTGTYGYSENPAMIVRDYLINKIFGCGHFIDSTMLDEVSFQEVADYCDELVTYIDQNGNTITEPHYTLNIILDTKKKHVEHLQDMFANFGGFLVFTNNHISLRIEKSTAVSYAFTDDTIIADSVTYTANTVEQTPNRYNITYYDPTQNWTGVKCTVENLVNQQPYPVGRGKIVPKDVVLTGCTRQSQALRLGRLFKDLAVLCPIVATWQTSTMAMHLEPGDVVTVTKNIVVDGVNQVLFDAMPFRILEISNKQGIWTIKGQQYNDSIYNDNLGAKISVKNYVPIDSPISDAVPSIENMVVSEYGWMNKDGTHISSIDISWDATSYQYFRQYIVSYSTDGDIYKSLTTVENHCIIPNVEPSLTYYIKVQIQNSMGRSSNAETQDIYITGKDNLPQNVSSLTTTQTGSNITVTLVPNNEPDISYYELRMGYSWDNSVLIDKIQSKYIFEAPQDGTLTFWVKAVDNFGNYSEIATKSTVNIFGLPEKNIVVNITEDLSLWNTMGMSYVNNAYSIKSKELLGDYVLLGDLFGITLHYTDNPYIDLPVIDLGPHIVDTSNFYIDTNGNYQVNSVELLGDYESIGDIFGITLHLQEIKYITQTFLTFNIDYNQDPNNRIDIVYATSFDGVTWGNYVSSVVKQFFGRYIKVRLCPISIDGITDVTIKGMSESIDVPDMENIINSMTIPANTTHITFKQKFFAIPKSYYAFTSDTTGKQATNRITNVTNEGFDLDILNDTGINIAGILQQAMIRGY